MNTSAGGVAGLVFKQAIRGDLGKLSLDGQMLRVLVSFDGKKTLLQVAEQMNVEFAAIKLVVAKLVKLRIIERVDNPAGKGGVLDEGFIAFLISQLSVAIGPIGAIVVEDGLEDMGYSKGDFPVSRVAELVNLLAKEIQHEDKRIQFKQAMLKKLKEKS